MESHTGALITLKLTLTCPFNDLSDDPAFSPFKFSAFGDSMERNVWHTLQIVPLHVLRLFSIQIVLSLHPSLPRDTLHVIPQHVIGLPVYSRLHKCMY